MSIQPELPQTKVTTMTSKVYVGMDVHKESYTLCCYSFATDKLEYKQKIAPDYKMVLRYIERIRTCYVSWLKTIDLGGVL